MVGKVRGDNHGVFWERFQKNAKLVPKEPKAEPQVFTENTRRLELFSKVSPSKTLIEMFPNITVEAKPVFNPDITLGVEPAFNLPVIENASSIKSIEPMCTAQVGRVFVAGNVREDSPGAFWEHLHKNAKVVPKESKAEPQVFTGNTRRLELLSMVSPSKTLTEMFSNITLEAKPAFNPPVVKNASSIEFLELMCTAKENPPSYLATTIKCAVLVAAIPLVYYGLKALKPKIQPMWSLVTSLTKKDLINLLERIQKKCSQALEVIPSIQQPETVPAKPVEDIIIPAGDAAVSNSEEAVKEMPIDTNLTPLKELEKRLEGEDRSRALQELVKGILKAEGYLEG